MYADALEDACRAAAQGQRQCAVVSGGRSSSRSSSSSGGGDGGRSGVGGGGSGDLDGDGGRNGDGSESDESDEREGGAPKFRSARRVSACKYFECIVNARLRRRHPGAVWLNPVTR